MDKETKFKHGKEMNEIHQRECGRYISNAIDFVRLGFHQINGEWRDTIDDLVTEIIQNRTDMNTVICPNCNASFTGPNVKRKRKCNKCKTSVKFKNKSVKGKNSKLAAMQVLHSDKNFESQKMYLEEHCRYEWLECGHKGKTKVSMQPPIFENPNSKEAVCRIMRQIGIVYGINKYLKNVKYPVTKDELLPENTRKWTMVACDGRPYVLLLSLIENTVRCLSCDSYFMTEKEFILHAEDKHRQKQGISVYARELELP